MTSGSQDNDDFIRNMN